MEEGQPEFASQVTVLSLEVAQTGDLSGLALGSFFE
jgi:hypothetical protein